MASSLRAQEAEKVTKVVLDTNILVAAGFERRSSSAQIVQAVRADRIVLTWDEPTLAETRHILRKIPPLRWEAFADLYTAEGRHAGDVPPTGFDMIADPADRKFAALAVAADAVLVSNDDHLLGVSDRLPLTVLTPGAFIRRFLPD